MSLEYETVALSIIEDNCDTEDESEDAVLNTNVECNEKERTDDINSNRPISNESSIDHTKAYITKYDYCGLFIWCLTCLFLVSWIAWMCWNIRKLNFDQIMEIIPRILVQTLLIIFIIFQIYMLIKSEKTGIQIYEPEQIEDCPGKFKSIINKIKHLYETKRINVRILVNKLPKPFFIDNIDKNPQKAVEFLYSSFIMLAILKLIVDLVPIIINLCSAEQLSLYDSGLLLLYTALGNIFMALYAKYCCCCNPCRRRWCWYKSRFDSICRYLSCQCCYEAHFPSNHLPYIHAATIIVFFSAGLKFAGAMGQISAITDIYWAYQYKQIQTIYSVDIPEWFENYTVWDLWWTCFNFLLGVYGIIGMVQIQWRYYYLLCFYWSRLAVNKYENHKIIEILSELLNGVYRVVYIKMDEEQDEFITIDQNESIAERVKIKCDCFTVCCMILPSLGISIGVAIILFMNTRFLNDMTSIMKPTGSTAYESEY